MRQIVLSSSIGSPPATSPTGPTTPTWPRGLRCVHLASCRPSAYPFRIGPSGHPRRVEDLSSEGILSQGRTGDRRGVPRPTTRVTGTVQDGQDGRSETNYDPDSSLRLSACRFASGVRDRTHTCASVLTRLPEQESKLAGGRVAVRRATLRLTWLSTSRRVPSGPANSLMRRALRLRTLRS